MGWVTYYVGRPSPNLLAAAVIRIRRQIFRRRKFYGAVPRMRGFDVGLAGRL